MLKHTFRHIEGFGTIKETDLWKSGIVSWDIYVQRKSAQLTMFPAENPVELLKKSFEAYEKKDADFFANTLPPSEYYRIALSFPEDVMFVDIETTGLSRYYDHITLIGWSFLDQYDVYYPGLNKEKLIGAFQRAKCIVTFNGSLFDLPFIKNEFPDLKIPICHIDLRFYAKRFGYSGGQKKIELEINFKRSEEAEKITGEIAPILWHKYKEGSAIALKRLITYNRFDIDGMKSLFDVCVSNSVLTLEYIQEQITPFKFSDFPTRSKFSEKSDNGFVLIKPYQGKLGPTITLKDLPVYKNLSIVGIDLTGSEDRASGWCHLLYNKAITKRLNSDESIIAETLKNRPDIISIDSPLSLPFGRKTVFDDDEGRDEFGIMRVCERILKKRGVSVYPSLIPSMQKLTRRGIMLANEFRKRGVPVIESYPGAAQDILGIPRKRASLEYLIKGLIGFGIKGDYETIEVSHDELDAITSAMLGYFFWCGKFEALGTEDEDYLIIPTIDDVPNKSICVIGLSGLLASGKTTAGKMIQKMGFEYGRYSLVLGKFLKRENNEVRRSNLQEFGQNIHETKGQRWLGNELLKMLPKDKNLVIDGLRFLEDHSLLKERFGNNFLHINIVTKEEERRKRYNKLIKNDIAFEEANKHNVENEINELSKFADIVVTNDGSKEELGDKLKKNHKEKMPVSVIIGGQFGSEGKGKVANYFAKKYKAAAVVRIGGPNSGHTVINIKKEPIIFKHLPTSCLNGGIKSVLTSGNYINVDILLAEIKVASLNSGDLLIDPYAVIITSEDIQNEQIGDLRNLIGSTACGLGSAVCGRISRKSDILFAKDVPALKEFIFDTNRYLRKLLDEGERIIIEGTQGFGLSLLHSGYHPYSTSRDTSAAGFVSEAGLSPLDIDDIIMVIRAFPIRVAGNSGPLKGEITWEEISKNAGSASTFQEFTSVTKKLRRVAVFDEEIVLNAIRYNNPTQIVMNHVDYVDKTISDSKRPSEKIESFVDTVEKRINRKIDFLGFDRETLIAKSIIFKESICLEKEIAYAAI